MRAARAARLYSLFQTIISFIDGVVFAADVVVQENKETVAKLLLLGRVKSFFRAKLYFCSAKQTWSLDFR